MAVDPWAQFRAPAEAETPEAEDPWASFRPAAAEPVVKPTSRFLPDEGAEPVAAIPETEEKPDYNKLRGVGERGGTLLGNLMGGIDKIGDEISDAVGGLGGFAAVPGEPLSDEKPGYKYLNAAEFAAVNADEESTKLLEEYGDDLKSTDFGYEQHEGWEQGKEVLFSDDSSFGDKVGAVGDVISWGFETGIVSLPDMVGAVVAPPAYIASRTNEIAEERAAADGREGDVTSDDLGIGAVTAVAVTILERFGAQKLLSFAKNGDGIIKGALAGGATEALTEAQQELAEYLGAQAGTEKGVTFMEGLERTLQGMVGGGAFGVPAGGVSGAVGNMLAEEAAVNADGGPDANPGTQATDIIEGVGGDTGPAEGMTEVGGDITGKVDEYQDAFSGPSEAEVDAPSPELLADLKPEATPDPNLDLDLDEDFVAGMDTPVVTPSPEPSAALVGQMEELRNPETKRKAVLVTEGETKPKVHKGRNNEYTLADGDTLITNKRDSKVVSPLINKLNDAIEAGDTATVEAVKSELLDYGTPQGKQGATEVVTTRDETGQVISDVALDPQGGALASAEETAAVMGNTVEIRAPEDAIAERAADVQAEQVGDLEAGIDPGYRTVEFKETDTQKATPAVKLGIDIVNSAMQEHAKFRETTGAGRKPTGSREQQRAADTAWLGLTEQLVALDAEGYDIKGLKEVLKVAAGNRVPNRALHDSRMGPDGSLGAISGRVQGANADTKRAPKLGWSTILEDFYTGVDRELTKMATEGPTPVAPKAAAAKKVSKKKTITPLPANASKADFVPSAEIEVDAEVEVAPEDNIAESGAGAVVQADPAETELADITEDTEGELTADEEAAAVSTEDAESVFGAGKGQVPVNDKATKTFNKSILNSPEEEADILMRREQAQLLADVKESVVQEKLAKVQAELDAQAEKKAETQAAENKADQAKASESKPVIVSKKDRAKAVSKKRTGAKITLKKKKPVAPMGKESLGIPKLTPAEKKADVAAKKQARADKLIAEGELLKKSIVNAGSKEKIDEKAATLDAAAHEAATSPKNDIPLPTEAQIEANDGEGNYKKGHYRWDGLPITIENPAGSKRQPEWPPLANHYGDWDGTIGADGDKIDGFFGPLENGKVFIVNQVTPDGKFDEHKTVTGLAETVEEATQVYKDNYSKGFRVGPVIEATVDEFKAWLETGDTTQPYEASQDMMAVEEPLNDDADAWLAKFDDGRILEHKKTKFDESRSATAAHILKFLKEMDAVGKVNNPVVGSMMGGGIEDTLLDGDPLVARYNKAVNEAITHGGMFTTPRIEMSDAITRGVDNKPAAAIYHGAENKIIVSPTNFKGPQAFEELTRAIERAKDRPKKWGLFDKSTAPKAQAKALSTHPDKASVIKGRTGASAMMGAGLDIAGEMTADGLLNTIRKNLHESDPYRALIDRMQELGVSNITVTRVSKRQMAKIADADTNGVFVAMSDGTREILINDTAFDGNDSFATKVFMHEMVHAMTAEALRTNNATALKLEALRKQLVRALEAEGGRYAAQDYGFTNVDEFVAEAFTNPEFQRLLASMDIKGPRGKTLWTKFLDILQNFMGLNIDSRSALAEVLTLGDSLFLTPQEVARGQLNPAGYISEESELDMPATASEIAMMMGDSSQRVLAHKSVTKTVEAVSDFVTKKGQRGARIGKKGVPFRVRLGLSTMDQIIRNHAGLFQKGGKNLLKDLQKIQRQKTQIARHLQLQAGKIERIWKDLEKQPDGYKMSTELGTLMRDSTLNTINSDSPFYSKANSHLWYGKSAAVKRKNHERHTAAKKKFDAMPPRAKSLYRQVKNFYTEQRVEMRKATVEKIAKINKLDVTLTAQDYQTIVNATKPEDISGVDFSPLADMADGIKQTLDTVLFSTKVEGPYFPLRRFGDNAVDAVRETVSRAYPSRGDAIAASKIMKANHPLDTIKATKVAGDWHVKREERIFETFESKLDAEDRAMALDSEGFSQRGTGGKVEFTIKQQSQHIEGSGAGQLLQQAKGKLKLGSAESKALETAFTEMLLANSLQKAELKRNRVKGADANMRRGFAERAFAGSWALADMSTSFEQSAAMKDLTNFANKESTNKEKSGEVVAELNQRNDRALSERATSKLDSVLSKLGFVWYLMSPSYTLVNMTQPLLVAEPYLVGKYGAKGAGELFMAYKGISKVAAKELWKVKAGWDGGPENMLDLVLADTKGSPVGDMLRTLTDQGIIDATFMQELYEASQGVDTSTIGKRATTKVMDVARTMPQIAEVVNRVVVAKAAYALDMKKNGSHELAVEAAGEAILQTQFDYSDQNKPRYFKGPPGVKSIMMFKMYGQGMYALMAANLVKSFNGKTKAEKAEGAKTLSLLLASHTFAAGTLGGLMIEPIRALIWVIDQLVNDDDEEWDVNAEVELFLKDTLGDGFAAEALTRGVPAALGIGGGERVSMEHMFLMGLNDTKSMQEGWIELLVKLGGPVVAIGSSGARGWDYWKQGETLKAAEALLPKGFRDAIRGGIRYPLEGPTNWSGAELPVDLGPADMVSQFFGVTPPAMTKYYDAMGAIDRNKKKIENERKRLIQAWSRSDNEVEFENQYIMPFNDRNEIENGITLKDLDTKIEGRYDKADELRFGADKMSDREFELREKLLGQ